MFGLVVVNQRLAHRAARPTAVFRLLSVCDGPHGILVEPFCHTELCERWDELDLRAAVGPAHPDARAHTRAACALAQREQQQKQRRRRRRRAAPHRARGRVGAATERGDSFY
eukprot:scaffold230725_cov30-Tisochrysis_lutea.AAC.1